MGTLTLKVSNGMTKAEETLALEKLERFFTENSDNYLADLFKTDFTLWCNRRMASDFTLDVMEYVNDTDKDDEIAKLKSKLDISENLGQQACCDKEFQEARVADLEEKLVEAKDKAHEAFTGTSNKIYQLREEVKRKEQVVEDQELEITRLKASLFDAVEKGFAIKS